MPFFGNDRLGLESLAFCHQIRLGARKNEERRTKNRKNEERAGLDFLDIYSIRKI